MARKDDANYIRVAETLEHLISAMPPRTLLATEQQLSDQFGFSRVTIRRALGVLERSGLITRRRGRGIIVSPPRLVRHLSPACSIDQDFHDQGVRLRTKVLSYESSATPADDVRTRLKLANGATVGALRLARIVDEDVICYDQRFIPSSIASYFDPEEAADKTISSVLQDISGKEIVSSDIEVDIVPSSKEVAANLRLGAAALVAIHSFTEYLEDDSVLQVGIMAYRVDRVRFRITQLGAPFATALPVPVRDAGKREISSTRVVNT